MGTITRLPAEASTVVNRSARSVDSLWITDLPSTVADLPERVTQVELHVTTSHWPNVKAYVTRMDLRERLADGNWVCAPLDAVTVQTIRTPRFSPSALAAAHTLAVSETIPNRAAATSYDDGPPVEVEANRKVADLIAHVVDVQADEAATA